MFKGAANEREKMKTKDPGFASRPGRYLKRRPGSTGLKNLRPKRPLRYMGKMVLTE